MEQGIRHLGQKKDKNYRLMTARFDGRCVYKCGKPLLAGMEIVYAVQERTVEHAACCPFLADLQAAA